MDAFRHRILDLAADESCLWDVRLPLVHVTGGQEIEIYPETRVEELRPALEQALREELVVLQEIHGRTVLTQADALAVLGDETNWYSPFALGSEEPRARVYCLALTELGRESREEAGEPPCYLTRLGTDT